MHSLHNIINYVSALDVICTKAFIAKKYNYYKPCIEDTQESSYLIAENLRHPLIEQINTNELYVTNNISLGVEGTKSNGVLLYGTNAVGNKYHSCYRHHGDYGSSWSLCTKFNLHSNHMNTFLRAF